MFDFVSRKGWPPFLLRQTQALSRILMPPGGWNYDRWVIGTLAVVERWSDAVNEQYAAQVEALSSQRVEIVGPREQGPMERSVLGQWLTRAGFTSKALRRFGGSDGRSRPSRRRSGASLRTASCRADW